jgi:hypothetical protein
VREGEDGGEVERMRKGTRETNEESLGETNHEYTNF